MKNTPFFKNQTLKTNAVALFVTTISFGTFSCKKTTSSNAGDGAALLTMEVTGEAALSYNDTAGALNFLDTSGYVAAGGTTSATRLSLVQSTTSDAPFARLGEATGNTLMIIFGYGRAEAAQLQAKIVPCKEIPGSPGGFAWKTGERCLVPQGSGVTTQLALLSCGTLDGSQSACDSYDDLLALMGGTFFNPNTALKIAEDNPNFVDTDFDSIGRVAGAKGNLTVKSYVGQTSYRDAVINRYRAARGGKLSQASSADLEADVVSIKGRGIVGYSLYENGADPGGGPYPTSNSGDPFPDGTIQSEQNSAKRGAVPSGTYYPSQGDLKLSGGSFMASGISGNVKLYMMEAQADR